MQMNWIKKKTPEIFDIIVNFFFSCMHENFYNRGKNTVQTFRYFLDRGA